VEVLTFWFEKQLAILEAKVALSVYTRYNRELTFKQKSPNYCNNDSFKVLEQNLSV